MQIDRYLGFRRGKERKEKLGRERMRKERGVYIYIYKILVRR